MMAPADLETLDGPTAADPVRFQLQLYVSGATPRSTRAIANIRTLIEVRLRGQCDLEVFDVCQQPGLLRLQQIVVLPTLIKQLPPPIRRMIGDLSDATQVVLGLGLVPEGPVECGPAQDRSDVLR
jgi:circadian clock protein KaiB